MSEKKVLRGHDAIRGYQLQELRKESHELGQKFEMILTNPVPDRLQKAYENYLFEIDQARRELLK
jgi:hypothetical protein